MAIVIRIGATVLVATPMAMIGTALAQGDIAAAWSAGTLHAIVPRSIAMWVLLAIPLAGLPIIVGPYVGILSPFVGGLSFGPMGVLIVLLNAPS